MPTDISPLDALRVWILKHCDYGHPIRNEVARAAMSATIRRTVLFGIESGLRQYSARELLQLQLMIQGEVAENMARIAFLHAVTEADVEVIQAYDQCGCFPDLLTWLQQRQNAEAQQAATLCEQDDEPERQQLTRLVCCRRYPMLLQAGWFDPKRDVHPMLLAELARLAAQRRPDLHSTVVNLLHHRMDVLMAREPDDLLEPLVQQASIPPQDVLAPFTGCYGDRCLAAAAEWHLQHDNKDAVLEICGRIRPLSPEADQARCLAGHALLSAGRIADAKGLRGGIVAHSYGDALDIRIAQLDPEWLVVPTLQHIAGRCRPEQPERFVACLRLLLAKRALEPARTLANERQLDYQDDPAAKAIINTILTLGAG
jgi:hypothetical protein